MKTCSACRQQKDDECFSWKSRSKGQRQDKCKPCYNAYYRAYYNNGENKKQIARVVKRGREIYAEYREWKESIGCSLCDEHAPECIEFHHLDPLSKDVDPSHAIKLGWAAFQREIAKCVPLCSNCHRKVHAGRIVLH